MQQTNNYETLIKLTKDYFGHNTINVKREEIIKILNDLIVPLWSIHHNVTEDDIQIAISDLENFYLNM